MGETEAKKPGCPTRCSNNAKSCANSRTGYEWRRLVGAYFLFYIFLSAWMASLMTIYMQTRPPQCTFRNGDFCVGAPRIFERIRARISQNASLARATYWCNMSQPECYGTSTVRLNTIWALRTLDDPVKITCALQPTPQLTETEAYQLTKQFPPMDLAGVTVRCPLEPVPATLAAYVGPHGYLGNRSCTIVGNNTAVFEYTAGAYAPYYQNMVTIVPTSAVRLQDGQYASASDTTTLRYLQYKCTANSSAAYMAEFDTTHRWPSSQMQITMAFGAYDKDSVEDGKPEEEIALRDIA